MTWASRIFFSALLLGSRPETATPAMVRGSVALVESRDPMVRRHKDYSGVVVWLEPSGRTAVSAPAAPPAVMHQKNKTFIPHVLAVEVGNSVRFPNEDPIFHNAFSNFNGQIFDVGLYKPGSSRTVPFRSAGIVRVFCNIHPQMSAVIAVLPTPYFAVSDKNGAYEIDNVPEGDYDFHVFHERASPETLDKFVHRISVETARLELPPLTISESGYLASPHLNKYDKAYPPEIDRPAYPGASK